MSGDATYSRPDISLDRLQSQIGGEIADGVVGKFELVREYCPTRSALRDAIVEIEKIYCNIRVPGNVNANHVELVMKRVPPADGSEGPITEIMVNDYPTRRFPRAWDAFLRGEDLRPEGTLLEDCEAMPKARIQALRAIDIHTVEELADIPDRALQRIGPDGRALQRAALKWLEDNGKADRDRQRLVDLEDEVKALRSQLAAQQGAVNEPPEDPTSGDDQDVPAKRGKGARGPGS